MLPPGIELGINRRHVDTLTTIPTGLYESDNSNTNII